MAIEPKKPSGTKRIGKNTAVTQRSPAPQDAASTATVTPQASPSVDGIPRTPSGGGGGHGSQHGTSSSHVFVGPIQDLLTENLLLGAPRVTFEGQQCPSLGGIPLLRKLGQGGMGAVYYGVHPRLSIEVAVKVLPYHLAEKDPLLVERFFREAQISAAVHSPYLVNVMDVNEESGVFFLVMEFVNGMSAKDRLAQAIRSGASGMAEAETLHIAIAATTGLAEAHSRGVVHRDVKPENIMVPYVSRTSKDLDVSAAKLMDLGLARADQGVINSPVLTATKQAMGTPGYMAPEQIMDARTATPRSDIFSMGASIYAMLTGQSPFKRKNSMQTLMASMQAPHTPLLEACPGVSEKLSHVVDVCLAKEQGDRYADGAALLAELKECLSLVGTGPLTVATHAPNGDEAQQAAQAEAATPARKRKLLFLYGAVAAIILLSVAIGSIVWSRGGESPAVIASHKKFLDNTLDNMVRNYDVAELFYSSAIEINIHDAKERAREKAVGNLMESLKALGSDNPNLDEIDQKLKLAEDVLIDHTALARVRDKWFAKKKSSEQSAIVTAELDAVDSLLKKGDFAKAAEKLSAAEKDFPANERVARIRKEYNEKKTAYETTRATRLKNVQELLANPTVDFAEIDRKISDFDTAYPQDSETAVLRNGLKTRRETVRKSDIDTASALINDEKSDSGEAERQVAQLERKYSGDNEVKALRTALINRKSREDENKRLGSLRPYLDAFDTAMQGDQPDLVKARGAILDADKFAKPNELAARKTLLANAEFAAEKKHDFKDVEDAIGNKVAGLDEAQTKLDALAKKYTGDSGLEALRSALAKRRTEVATAQETERLNKIKAPLGALQTLLTDRSSDLKEAEKKLADAKQLGATAAELAPYQRKFEDEKAWRTEHAKLFADIETLFADKTASSGDLEKQYVALQAKYPGDAKLADIGKRIDQRKQAEQLAAESDRKKRVTPLLDEIGTALAAAAPDFEAIQKKLTDAEGAGATVAELQPLQKKLNTVQTEFTDRQRAFKAVEDAISDSGEDTAAAEKKLTELSGKYRNAPGLDALQAKLSEKKQSIVAAKDAKKKADIKALLDDADKIVATADSSLEDARKKVFQAQTLGAATAEVESRRAKIAAEDERRYTSAIIRQVDDIIGDKSSDPAPAESLLVRLEQKYPANTSVKEARQRFELRKKGHLAELETKQREQNLKTFDGFVTSARASLTAKDLPTADRNIKEAEKLFPQEPRLAPLKTDYATAKKKADEDALAAAKKKAEEDAVAAAAKKKADDEAAAATAAAAAKKKADDDARAAALAAAAKKKAEEDAALAAKKRADEIATKKTTPPPPPQPEKKRKRIGEEDVDN